MGDVAVTRRIAMSDTEVQAAAITPTCNDREAGAAFAALVEAHHSSAIVATVHTYFSNIGEYEFRCDMEPRAFLQFCSDSRLLAEDFTYADAEDITAKLVED